MKRILSIGIVLVILISGCAPAVEVEPTTASDTLSTPMATLTSTSLPTATRRPSATPTITPIPPATLTPMTIISASAHPKTLNEINSGIEMVRVNLLDVGGSYEINFSSAGIIELDGVTRYVVSAIYPDGQIKIIDLLSGVVVRVLQLDCCAFTGLAFAPDQRTVATIDEKTLRLWDLQSQQIIYEMDLKESFAGPLAFSPDAFKLFMTRVSGGDVLELNLQTGETVEYGSNSYGYSYGDPYAVENYHFSALGNMVMFRYEEHKPVFEDTVTKEKIVVPSEVKLDSDYVEAFAISSDGKYLAIGTLKDIFVWDTATLKLLVMLSGHSSRGADGWSGKIRRLLFAPHSNLLVSVGADGTTRLWNIKTGNEIRRLNVCCSASFTPDGRYLVTAGDGVIRVWGVP